MKKLLLSAVAVLGLMPGLTSTASAELVAEDRSGWIISGCSQRPASAGQNDDGDLTRVLDGNVNTYWHSYWNGHNAQNHYFVVDRGPALANTELSAIGYTPRQGVTQGNGFVTACDIYILDSVVGLITMGGTNDSSGGFASDGHESLTTFVSGKTPTAQGTFNYTWSDADNRGESKVTFTPTAGRYILFVATNTSGDQGNYFANCAEFNAYTEEEEVDLTQKVQLPGSGLAGVAELVNGQEYLIYDNHSNRYGFHYVESGNTSQVKKTQKGLDATDLLDLSYVWVAEEVEGGWKFVNKDCGQYIKPVTWWNNAGVDGTGGIFEVTYNNDSESTFTIKNTTSDGYYWSGDVTYLAGDDEGGKHTFMFIEAAPLYTGSVPVTLTYPEVGGMTGKVTVDVPVGTSIDANGIIPAPDFFTVSGVAEADKVVSGTNNKFSVEGTWAFPFEPNQVYRIDIRQKSTQHGCSNLLYEASTKKVNTRNTTNQDAFVPERLFYLTGKGFDETTGNMIVTLHSIAADASTGFQVAVGNNSVGAFSETPTEFRVVTNSNGTGTGISLQHPESNITHVNDLSSGLGVWNNAGSQNDNGSFLRFFALTDDDFNGISSREDAYMFSQENIEAAKASKNADDVRTLFAGTVIVANANALLSTLTSYTSEHFADAPGYLYGSDYVTIAALAATLTEALASQDIAAITVAYEALAAEVAKVQMHLPETGKFYRFQNKHSNLYMTSIVNDANDLTLVENGADALETIFYFDGTRLVAWQNGLVLGNYNTNETEDSWKTVLKGASNEGEITFPVSDVFGSFYIQTQLDRRLYGGADTNRGSAVDCAGLSTGEKYSWVITEVTELPIAYNEGFVWSTLYSPVQLGLIENKVKAYTGTLNDEDPENVTLVVTELTGSIPANTGVILGVVKSEDIVVNGYVYLPIEDNTADEAASDLAGSFYTVAQEEAATAAEEGVYNFLFQEDTVEDPETHEKSNFGKFNLDMASDLVGFTAYVTASSIDADEVITIADSEGNNPTGIEEIVVESEMVQGIYDLQGRRLSTPVKGINIINGKKVLVK